MQRGDGINMTLDEWHHTPNGKALHRAIRGIELVAKQSPESRAMATEQWNQMLDRSLEIIQGIVSRLKYDPR